MFRVSSWLRFTRRRVVLAPETAYEAWAATYPPHAHNPLMHAEERAMAMALNTIAPARALDLGTGSGRYLPLLARTGARLVIGLDLSPAMLARGAPGSLRVRANACRLPFRPGTFDLITAGLMIGDVPDLAAWMHEVASALADGGHLVFSDFHPSWAAGRWRRTFRDAQGHRLELPYYARSIEMHVDAMAAAGLRVRAIREPRIQPQSGEDGWGDDLQGGATRGGRWGDPPVAAVFHAQKTGVARRRPEPSPSPMVSGARRAHERS